MRKFNPFMIGGLALIIAVAFNNCGGPNSPFNGAQRPGNLNQGVSTGVAQGTTGGNPLTPMNFSSFHSESIAALSICIKHVRLKSAVKGQPDQNINFDMGQIHASSYGTNLGFINVAPGTYSEVDLDVEDQCYKDKSAGVKKKSGKVLVTQAPMNMKFVGTFTSPGASAELDLDIQEFIKTLNQVSEGPEIAPSVNATLGTF